MNGVIRRVIQVETCMVEDMYLSVVTRAIFPGVNQLWEFECTEVNMSAVINV